MPTIPIDKEAIEKHIKPKMDDCNCPVCKSIEWVYPEALFEIREFLGGNFAPTPTLIPLVVVTCQICGFVMLFNAIHTQAFKLKELQHG